MSENVAFWREQALELHGRATEAVEKTLGYIPSEHVRRALALSILKDLAEIGALREGLDVEAIEAVDHD